MTRSGKKTIRFRGRAEPVLKTFHVRGRHYFALEKLGRRGAFRVFDPHAGPGGDYRVLYQLSKSKVTRQQLEILRRLSQNGNRNFPGIVDFAHVEEHIFVVIAWVAGTNLRAYLKAVRERKTPRPSVPEVARLVRGLAHGVTHYHRRTNIVHGDISAANIIITTGTKQLVLIDFGSAWPVENGARRGPNDGVTQPYAAPERICGHAAEDFRSDMFSLSAIAYEMLTMVVPYEGLAGQAGPKLAAKIAPAYRAPSTLVANSNRLPRKSLRLIDDCLGTGLRLHPDERFATSSEWLSAWDEVYFRLKKHSRPNTGIGQMMVSGFNSISRLFRRKHF